ncbi:Membrane bound subgroup 4b [NiFe]-hydrogenase MBH(b)1, subunit Mbh(b)1D [Thermococcus barophilus]|uniref:Membrane bound subgroup 4b [NiFe]-hydrogenase MBH(B)1, subunit Mbh(B)1D n=2 Tax=Thermococcus barophilus TaxID=55802 RepID=A0A0S1XA21_THEBA|nr:Membrane bound subgroup 4b [NiFe]-hydrogenase MBH(b)1, subunit Mbh(b)1D [Thermococcus barophilus]
MLEVAALALLGCVVLMTLIVLEKDLLKVVAYSAVFSGLVLVTLYVLLAPDIILAYVAIATVLSTALLVYVIGKTGRYEVV